MIKRLTACRPTRAKLTASTTGSVITRYAPGILAQMNAIRAAGREPVVTAWSNQMDPGQSRSNPRGLPVRTIQEVK